MSQPLALQASERESLKGYGRILKSECMAVEVVAYCTIYKHDRGQVGNGYSNLCHRLATLIVSSRIGVDLVAKGKKDKRARLGKGLPQGASARGGHG